MHQTRGTAPPFPTQLAFVVQFAAETAGGRGRFVGRVEHVVSGQVAHFVTLDALLAFMTRGLAALDTTVAAPEHVPPPPCGTVQSIACGNATTRPSGAGAGTVPARYALNPVPEPGGMVS